MLIKAISRVLLAALVVVTASQLVKTSDATAGLFGTKLLDQTGCCRRCPACDHTCSLKAEIVEEEKPCFDVESKVVCIPRVVFPWQRKKCNACSACDGQGCTSCVHNGARTRRISVLKTDKYKCPKCKYTWTAERKPCESAANAGETLIKTTPVSKRSRSRPEN
jgi:hypothetical protein